MGFQWGTRAFAHSLLHWVNHGLLTIFFFVVGLEIKREFTVGHLATFRSGALPVIAALGGIVLPAVIYASIAPPELRHGWGIPIGTDTAFAVALIVLLGDRVPIELRVFLTAAVIIDDIVAIVVIALFYTGEIHAGYLIAGGAVTALLVVLNRTGVYGALPYAVCGVVLWFFLHEAGLHATLAGVILAVLIPTRPPANLNALLAQAATVIHLEDSHTGEAMRPGPSEPALRTLDAIHARIESPADKLLRSVEPWSSYVVLPIFALANAGVAWSPGVFEGHGRLICAITLGLVLGKPIGIVLAAWLAVRTGVAAKPDAYSWRQLCGAGALGGIGFTMSLFIAGVAFPDRADYAAAKIAIFLASLIAGGLGVLILWPRPEANDDRGTAGRSFPPPPGSARPLSLRTSDVRHGRPTTPDLCCPWPPVEGQGQVDRSGRPRLSANRRVTQRGAGNRGRCLRPARMRRYFLFHGRVAGRVTSPGTSRMGSVGHARHRGSLTDDAHESADVPRRGGGAGTVGEAGLGRPQRTGPRGGHRRPGTRGRPGARASPGPRMPRSSRSATSTTRRSPSRSRRSRRSRARRPGPRRTSAACSTTRRSTRSRSRPPTTGTP